MSTEKMREALEQIASLRASSFETQADFAAECQRIAIEALSLPATEQASAEQEPVAGGDLIAALMRAADDYCEAGGHGETWTGSPASYGKHVEESRAKVVSEALKLLTAPVSTKVAEQEPAFFTAWADSNGPVPLPGFSNETEKGVKNLILKHARSEGYKGTVTSRLMDMGWWVAPVYSAPVSQPAPAANTCALTECQGKPRCEACKAFDGKPAPAPLPEFSDDEIDALIEPVLRAGGSSLRHYTMQKSKDDMRAAMRAAIATKKGRV